MDLTFLEQQQLKHAQEHWDEQNQELQRLRQQQAELDKQLDDLSAIERKNQLDIMQLGTEHNKLKDEQISTGARVRACREKIEQCKLILQQNVDTSTLQQIKQDAARLEQETAKLRAACSAAQQRNGEAQKEYDNLKTMNKQLATESAWLEKYYVSLLNRQNADS